MGQYQVFVPEILITKKNPLRTRSASFDSHDLSVYRWASNFVILFFCCCAEQIDNIGTLVQGI